MTFQYKKIAIIALCTASFLAQSAQAAKKIGVVGASNPSIVALDIASNERILKVGVDIFFNDVIRTGENGNAQIIFQDKSALTIGPNSSIMIDRFVYNPFTKKGDLSINAIKGAFRFIGGALSKKKSVTIKTPVSTIGIRGGIVMFNVAPDGATDATFLYGDELSVKGTNGIERITKSYGHIINVKDKFTPPTLPRIVTPEKLAGAVAHLAAKIGTNGGAIIIPSAKTIKGRIKTGSSDRNKEQNSVKDSSSKTKKTESKATKRKDVATAKTDDNKEKRSGTNKAVTDDKNNGKSDSEANKTATNEHEPKIVTKGKSGRSNNFEDSDSKDSSATTLFVNAVGGDNKDESMSKGVEINPGIISSLSNGEKVAGSDIISNNDAKEISVNDIKGLCEGNAGDACKKVVGILTSGYDSEGFDINGIDKDGFNKNGFAKDGFNKKGRNKSGFDRKGFDVSGFDVDGLNNKGFDNKGFDKEGFNDKGFNNKGFNNKGFNNDGFDNEGFDNAGKNKNGKTKSEVEIASETEETDTEEASTDTETETEEIFTGSSEAIQVSDSNGAEIKSDSSTFNNLQVEGENESNKAIADKLREVAATSEFEGMGKCGGDKCEYLSWGTWNFEPGGGNLTAKMLEHIENGKHLAIAGSGTTELAILAENIDKTDLPESGIVQYSGDIFGSHIDNDFSQNITDTGTFTSTVDISNQKMTSFDANLSGSDGSTITLSLSSSADIASTGVAIFNNINVTGTVTTGSFTGGGDISLGTINGGLFGPKAEEIGGNYSAENGTIEAAGIFAGKR